MCHFAVHDLSKEHDLKAREQEENRDKFREHVQSSASSMIGNSLNFTLTMQTTTTDSATGGKFPTPIAEEPDEEVSII